jgi:hypothetical protein
VQVARHAGNRKGRGRGRGVEALYGERRLGLTAAPTTTKEGRPRKDSRPTRPPTCSAYAATAAGLSGMADDG